MSVTKHKARMVLHFEGRTLRPSPRVGQMIELLCENDATLNQYTTGKVTLSFKGDKVAMSVDFSLGVKRGDETPKGLKPMREP